MKKYKLSHIFIYHNYLAVVFTDGAWEIMCSRYYVGTHGIAADRTAAETAAKAMIESWFFYKSEKQ